MNSILKEILEEKRRVVELSKKNLTLDSLKKGITGAPRDFKKAVSRPGRTNIIAEIKKASPSAGLIAADLDPAAIAEDYETGGAAAISVLTEEKYFQGHPSFITAVKKASNLPVLRKDFIFEDYQLAESRYLGADAVLLIAAVLDKNSLSSLVKAAKVLGLAPLVETHDERDVEAALSSGAELIGINNRDLKTFRVDLSVSGRLIGLIPEGKTVIIESGIKTAGDIAEFKKKGVNAFLIGETVMRSPDRAGKLKELAR